MHKKSLFLSVIAVLMCTVLLTGCAGDAAPTLPRIDLDGSSLTGTVEYINGRTCRIRITGEDSHYDEDDLIHLTYSTIEGSKGIKIGDQVSFSYHYTSDVSEYNGDPHITVNQVSVVQ